MNADTRESQFEDAWQYASGSPKLDRYRRESLVALAAQDSALSELAGRLSGMDRARLDLHVDEPTTAPNEVRAVALGEFVSRAAKAVHELTKAQLGRQRWRDDLRVFAPSPGSVRVVFLEPPARKALGGHPGLGHVPAPEAQAMRHLVGLLNLAEGDHDTLDAAVYRLKGPARRAVRLMSETVATSSWNVLGELRLARQDPIEIALGPAGASRLAKAARMTETEPVTATVLGQADGWTWSTSTLRILPDEGRAFDVAVPPEWENEVAAANARHQRIRVVLAGIRVHPTGDQGTERISFGLRSFTVEATLDV